MNEEELRWIVDNLFVGNRLPAAKRRGVAQMFDLKAIRSPIVVFSSAGDNITPPQQALNWIADVYSSTEEIKANGQVIVALLHPDVGHLGIFVSGRVAKREHTQIVEVLNISSPYVLACTSWKSKSTRTAKGPSRRKSPLKSADSKISTASTSSSGLTKSHSRSSRPHHCAAKNSTPSAPARSSGRWSTSGPPSSDDGSTHCACSVGR